MNFKVILLSVAIFMSEFAQANSICLSLFKSTHFKEAIDQCRDEANNGNVNASEILMQIYSTKGDFLNYSEAFKWAKSASDKGSTKSHAMLGLMYLRGDGTKKNIDKAQHYIQLAINNGNKGALKLRKLMKQAGLWRKPS